MLKKINNIIKIKNRFFYYRGPNPMKVIITGPPRSGTSFLAGLVVRMGYSPGPKKWLKKADKHNPYGYFECMPLMEIDHSLLKKFGGKVSRPPELQPDWINQCRKERKKIRKVVKNGGVEVYKGNMLIVFADLYAEIFPEAKWIMIYRGEDETAKSLKESTPVSVGLQESADIRKRLLEGWGKTLVSSNCLTVKYEDFMQDANQTVKLIAEYLERPLTDETMKECVDFFMPRAKDN